MVSTGAQTPALFGFQSPGDYATFNSNHTPDGTFQGEHNHSVFGELGLSECEIDGFIASGAL